MNNGEPRTVRELYIWIKQKFINLEDKIIAIAEKPDNMGKWIVRIAVILNTILVGISIYISMKK